LSTDHKAEDRQ